VHSDQLRGAKLVVFNDNDEPGYKHADTICKLSLGVADTVRRLDLKPHWPEIPEGGDVRAWLKKGGAPEKLKALMAAAPEYVGEASDNVGEAPVTPIDLWGHLSPPELPRGLLPAVIEQFAIEQGEVMGVDPGGLAVAALTVCAAAIPDSIELQVKKHDRGWTESARLWAALVGMPSTKKTPTLREAI